MRLFSQVPQLLTFPDVTRQLGISYRHVIVIGRRIEDFAALVILKRLGHQLLLIGEVCFVNIRTCLCQEELFQFGMFLNDLLLTPRCR